MIKRNQNEMPLGDKKNPSRYADKQPALTDEDKMPFGKHKDKFMKDVPASYLAWLYNEGCNNEMVANYIWNSFDAINMELDDEHKILRK